MLRFPYKARTTQKPLRNDNGKHSARVIALSQEHRQHLAFVSEAHEDEFMALHELLV